MLDEKSFDAVAIATPSGTHAEIALETIRRGVPTILEKPIALSLSDARRLATAAQRAKVCTIVCYQNRFNTALQAAKKAIDKHRVGNISHAALAVRWHRDERYYCQARWRGTWQQDGGALMNQSIHGIDALLWLVNDHVATVSGYLGRSQHPYIETEDVGVATITFRNGALATIEGTVDVFPRNLEETLYIFGSEGTIKVGGTALNQIDIWDFKKKHATDVSESALTQHINNVYGMGHLALYTELASALREQRPTVLPVASGLPSLELVLAIYNSNKLNHQPVELPFKEDFSTSDMMGTFL